MSKSTVTLELKVVEGTRIRGWGEDATWEYLLRHEKLGGELKFRCMRKDLEEVLRDMGASLEKFDDVTDVTLVDVGDELARASTGMPLSERDQKELQGLLSPDKPAAAQPKSGFKIRIG